VPTRRRDETSLNSDAGCGNNAKLHNKRATAMKTSGNTILITGGTSGIGFELATQLSGLGNILIVTGRHQANLDAARTKIPGIHTIQSDVSEPTAIVRLYQQVVSEFPSLNVLINNAGIMRKIDLHTFGSDLQELTREVEIDLNGSIRMVAQFLPHLKMQRRAAIVNVSSGLAFVPLPSSPVYCAAKAAIHSFTQSLRVQLKNTNITVFELAPPVTATPLLRGDSIADYLPPGVKPMDVKTLAQHAIDGIRRDRLEIRPGLSNMLKIMSRLAPGFILKQFSKPVDRMLAEKTPAR
jgi:uncharacterized oxidoreductase